ncbi:DUF6153 family protein [Streptomyces sp. 21So2-11]|uniref:DUF6153 family protein n=1 Tax=Streptomyces sp. 21So2-11 TaxID=3144408 RepID=UPI00321BCDE9
MDAVDSAPVEAAERTLRRRTYDERVIFAAEPSSRRPVGRGFALLVLAVLAGVLAMHGLSPGPVSVATPAAAGGHTTVTVQGTGHQGGESCSHTAGGSGHLDHADATCAATGIGAPYTPPALAPALDVAPLAAAPPGRAAEATEVERAPPDLAKLQLLRI